MSDLINIAVDAMGGDGSPKKIIRNYSLNSENSSFLLNYFENFLKSLKENTLNSYIKSVINPKYGSS